MALSSDSPFADRAPTVATTTMTPNEQPTTAPNTNEDPTNGDTTNGGVMHPTPAKTSIDTAQSTPLHDDLSESPTDFTGELNTNNEIPTQDTVLDKDGKTVPFRNIYSGPNVTRRVLVIFIRHFFCGVCPPSPPSPSLCYTDTNATFCVELSRIHTNINEIDNPLQPPPPRDTDLHRDHRLRLPAPHPDVRDGNLLPLPHLRRPDQETVFLARHAADAEPRRPPRVPAPRHIARHAAERETGVRGAQRRESLEGRGYASSWG